MAKPVDIKVKSIGFNLLDKTQRELFDYAVENSSNFSAYIKSLILRDMMGDWQAQAPQAPPQADTYEYMDEII